MSELAKALAKAQEAIGHAAKDSKNPHFNSKYADLSSVWAAWQEVGPKNGLSVLQLVKVRDDGKQSLVTKLMHVSGESIESEMLVLPTKPDMQGIGSALTYCRRYSLAALVGVVQDDDDGNAASKPVAKTEPKPAPPKMTPAEFVDGVIAQILGGEIDPESYTESASKKLAALATSSPTEHKRLMDFLNDTNRKAAAE